ncbi:hypothetical protein TNCV_2845411 [Trichonephila clavipes]|nr:hypothetical protein TNCV_2845411 [Trichonephila clavipes]
MVAEWFKVSDRGWHSQEFETSTTKDPPCRAEMHVKYVESSNVLPLCDEPHNFKPRSSHEVLTPELASPSPNNLADGFELSRCQLRVCNHKLLATVAT